jgi:RNA polymerase sigma-70 factor, ECF subfamily
MFRWPWKRSSYEDRREEFEPLIRAHADGLYSAALRMTRNREDAHDLAQEAAIRAFTHFSTFTPGTNFKAWMLRILTNVYISEFCRKRRTVTVSADDERIAVRDFPDDASADVTPGKSLWDAALDEEIDQALASLGDGVRLCVLLVDVEEMSYEEAASALNVPVGTVRSRLNRGREQLKIALNDYARRRNLV